MAVRAVIICDDHPLIRAGMAGAVAAEPGLTVAAQVVDLTAAVRALAEHPQAVLVARDRILYGTDPLEGGDLAEGGLVVGLDLLDEYSLRRIAGRRVHALVCRSGPPDDVRQAVLAVCRGAGFVAPDLAPSLLDLVRRGRVTAPGSWPGAVAQLTGRERQVLDLLSRGAANREIAKSLRITEKTVKFHVSNLLAKTRLRSRTQLIAWVAHGAHR